MSRRPRPVAVPAGGFRDVHVLRLGSLGDVILALATVEALRRAWPHARLTFWVKEEYADLARFDPAISHVRVLERDGRKLEDLLSMSAELQDADLIVDLHGNLRTRVLTFRQRSPVLRSPSYRLARGLRVHARWLGWSAPPTVLARHGRALARLGIEAPGPPRVHAGPDAEAWANAWLATWGEGGAPVAMIPGAAHATKRWPEAHWLDLHQRLREARRRLVYLGLEDDRARVPTLAAKIALDPGSRWCMERLPRVAALLSRCVTAVAGDTGLMHLAAARGVRVVTMFGSTAPELGFTPAGEGHAVLCRHEPCQPCTLHGRARCPKRHFRCMVGITAEQVSGEVTQIAGGG
ncbi:MAG: glycosyltransferase family 9 protein [Candidatus Eiseniibacteriota bacterium]